MSTASKAVRCVVFSTPLLPRPFYAKMPFSAPYSRTSSVYVPFSIWETKFHTHQKNKIIVLYILTFIYLDGKMDDKTLHRKIASIPWFQSSLNFFMNGILINQDFFQHLNCSNISNVLLSVFSAVILSCITISRQDHRLNFLSICFWYFISCPKHSDFSTQLYWIEIGANCNRNHFKFKKKPILIKLCWINIIPLLGQDFTCTPLSRSH